MATRYAVVELDTTGSTQDEARERFNGTQPILVIAHHQTNGRGRLGRTWEDPDVPMLASLAFESPWPIDRRSLIPLVAGLAARSAIESLSGISVDLRWPNDLMIEGGKVGGLLAESFEDLVVVGCGVNIAWRKPIDEATSLSDHGAEPVEPVALAVAWTDHLLDRLSRHPDDWGLDDYRRACITVGRSVSFDGGTGIATGIADDGALLVETPGGIVTVGSGEVRIDGPTTIPSEREGQ